jgi:cobalt/nickel transport system permease protein
MADALLSPAVGGTLWCASAATLACCSRRLRESPDDRRVALMGVLGAFLFTAQMINFAIPGTGSSGHLGGGLLLTILLGPYAAFVVMASVLIVQAMFFADGGLLALGCNIFNLGFFPAFIGYPIYRFLCGESGGTTRSATAAAIAAVISLELGAFAVVLETVSSGISALPLRTFVLFMLPIHLAIGLVEGLVTAAVVGFVQAARPGAISAPARGSYGSALLATFLCIAVALGGIGAWFASQQPDGLEWSVARVAGGEVLQTPATGLEAELSHLQSAIAVLPDYAFASSAAPDEGSMQTGASLRTSLASQRAGTSISGLVGGALVLLLATLAGFALRPRSPRTGS